MDMRKRLPATVLFFLSPAIGELLSGSAPPAEFFSFPGFLIITTLYGSGAILARELTVRWGKGWLTLLLFGAAYGIIEEGLMVKSFFDPRWIDLGILGTYGRWAGVNWVWSLELTIYHAVVSIATPVLLTELLFPSRRDDIWVGRGALLLFLFLLVSNVLLGYFLLTEYRPGGQAYAIAVALVATLVVLARLVPSRLLRPGVGGASRRPRWFWLVGFLGTLMFFVVFGGLPHTPLPPVATMLVGLAVVGLAAAAVLWMSGGGAVWDDRHRHALASGLLSPLVLMAPLQELDASRTDDPSGMAVVGLAAAFLLVGMWRWIGRQQGSRGTPS
jgi:hypothetical protein